MSDIDDPSTPRFFSKQKSEIDDILSDIDNDLSDDVMDIESFDDMPAEPLKAQKPFRGSTSSFGSIPLSRGSKSSSKLLMGTVLGLLVVGGAGGAYYYFMQANSYSAPPKIAAPLAPLAPPPAQDMAIPVPPTDGIMPTPPIVDGMAPPAPDMVAGANGAANVPALPNQEGVMPPVTSPLDANAPTETSAVTAESVTNPSAPDATPTQPADGTAQVANTATETTPNTPAPVTAPDTPAALPSNDAAQTATPTTDSTSPPLPQDGIVAPKTDQPTAPAGTTPTDPSKTALTAESKTDKVTKPSTKTEAIKYFDSPAGEILEDIQPPSIDVTRNPGESIIIVKKPVGYNRGYADGVYSNTGDGTVKIERSETSNVMTQKAVMADRALRLGRYDMALGYYQEILAQNSNDVSALLGRAIALQKSGNADAALQGYRDVLRRDPSNVTAATNMAGLQSGSNPNSALKNLSNVYNADPNNVSVKAQMGVSMAQSGNVEDAYNVFLNATKSEPRNPVHFYNLAVTAEKLGKRNEAIAAYEKCLEVDAIYGTGRGINRDAIYDRLSQIRG